MNKIFLLRHGESTKNFPVQIESCTMESADKYPLTQKGVAHAKAESEKYQIFFDMIIFSPFLRAKQTAEIFYAKSPDAEFLEDSRLQDLNVGDWNEKLLEDSFVYLKDVLKKDITKKYGGGENLEEVQKRVMSLYSEINAKYSKKNILFVSHASPLEVLKDSIEGKQISYWEEFLPNSTVIKVSANVLRTNEVIKII